MKQQSKSQFLQYTDLVTDWGCFAVTGGPGEQKVWFENKLWFFASGEVMHENYKV